ncbi:unnamed protein product [Caretta caretta]
MDSGAVGNFIDTNMEEVLGTLLEQKTVPSLIKTINGLLLSSGLVTLEILSLEVHMQDHREIHSPHFSIILSVLWLATHDLHILCPNPLTTQKPSGTGCGQLGPPGELTPALPTKCIDYMDFFEKKNAYTLSPHHDHDCPMELQSGTKIPFDHGYARLEPELITLLSHL